MVIHTHIWNFQQAHYPLEGDTSILNRTYNSIDFSENKKRTNRTKTDLSWLVDPYGFEP